MGRGTWYYEGHPPTCTCVKCSTERSKDSLTDQVVRFLLDKSIMMPVRYVRFVLRALRII
jgi:hypothetical protein